MQHYIFVQQQADTSSSGSEYFRSSCPDSLHSVPFHIKPKADDDALRIKDSWKYNIGEIQLIVETDSSHSVPSHIKLKADDGALQRYNF